MATRMQQRRGTATQWTAADPILAAGEIGYESDSGKFKIGDGINHWSSLSYFADASDFDTSSIEASIATAVTNAVNSIVDDAPAALNTLKEIATAIDNDSSFSATIVAMISSLDSTLSGHTLGTTNVHGIADTSLLATKDYAETVAGTAQDNAAIDATNKADLARTEAIAAATTEAATDATAKAEAALQDAKDYTDSKASDYEVAGAVTAHNNSGQNVHGIADTAELVTNSVLQSATEAVLADASDYADTVGTASVTAATSAAASDAASKVSTHAAVTTNVHGIADTSALATKTYVDDADALKAPKADPTFTGTVSGITKSMVGLGNVDNTSDANKPVSTATQTALDAKASLSGATFTGAVNGTSLTLSGNLTVNGTTTTVSSQNLEVTDPLIYIGTGNSANSKDLGIVGHYNDGTYQHSGLVRDASDGKWKLFTGVTTEPSDTIDFTTWTKDALVVGALEATTVTPSSGIVFSDGTQTKVGVPSITPIQQKTANYTLSALTERDNMIEMGSSSALTVTIPADSTLNFPVGASIDILQTGSGQVTIAGAGGVTVNATPGLKLRTQWSSATLTKRSANTWVVTGDLSA